MPFLITPNWLHDFKLMCDVAVGAMKNDSILGHQLPPRSPIARPKTHAPLPEIIHLFHSLSKLNLCTSQSAPFPFSYVSHRLFVSHVVRPSFLWSSRVRRLCLRARPIWATKSILPLFQSCLLAVRATVFFELTSVEPISLKLVLLRAPSFSHLSRVSFLSQNKLHFFVLFEPFGVSCLWGFDWIFWYAKYLILA